MKRLKPKFLFLLCSFILTGCQSPQTTTQVTISEPTKVAIDELTLEPVPVIRHGRFTLVEVNQLSGEQDLLSQIIEISVPSSLSKQKLTVKDGLNYVLIGSGYRLCQTSAINAMDKLPLPAAHHRLGPVTINIALKTIAGPTWQMQIDQHNRLICFKANPDASIDLASNISDEVITP